MCEEIEKHLFYFTFIFWPCQVPCRLSVPGPRIEPRPWQWKPTKPTRELPKSIYFKMNLHEPLSDWKWGTWLKHRLYLWFHVPVVYTMWSFCVNHKWLFCAPTSIMFSVPLHPNSVIWELLVPHMFSVQTTGFLELGLRQNLVPWIACVVLLEWAAELTTGFFLTGWLWILSRIV